MPRLRSLWKFSGNEYFLVQKTIWIWAYETRSLSQLEQMSGLGAIQYIQYTVYMYSILHRFTLYSSHASALMWQMHCRTLHIAQYAVRNVSSYNKKKTFERKLFYLSEWILMEQCHKINWAFLSIGLLLFQL